MRTVSALFVLALQCTLSSAQIPGTKDLCTCSPRMFNLTLDFSKTCEPIEVDLSSGGILDATCLISGFDNITLNDWVPVAVSSIQLIEIAQDESPAAVAQETGDFRHGDTINYVSISFEGAAAPRAFQVRALGRNTAGEPLVLQMAITFSNDCSIFPVVSVGDSVGWMVFDELEDELDAPLNGVCSAAMGASDLDADDFPLPDDPPVSASAGCVRSFGAVAAATVWCFLFHDIV